MPSDADSVDTALRHAAFQSGLALSSGAGRPLVMTAEPLALAHSGDTAGQGWVRQRLACGMHQPVVLWAAPSSLIALADVVLGGRGTTAERAPMPMELRLAFSLLTPALSPVAAALAPWGAGEFVASEPEIVDDQPTPATSTQLRWDFTIGGLDEDLPFRLSIPMPAPVTQTVAPVVVTTHAARALAGVPVTMHVQLQATRIAAADLQTLAPGDVLRLDHPAAAPVSCRVDERTLMTARLGRRGAKLAIHVQSLEEDPS